MWKEPNSLMGKFNKSGVKTATGSSPIITTTVPSGRTHEGGAGFARDAKGELFLLAVANLVGENTFYETAGHRDSRYETLIGQVAVEDPQWMAGFLGWLRREGNMRSASIVGALEAARAMLAAELPGARQIVASVLQRADEPGEALAYWTSRYGRAIPKPIKRGIADAVRRLYNERSLLKYDTGTHTFRFGDVVDLVHPEPSALWQGDLFKFALDRRHGRPADHTELASMLPTVASNMHLRRRVAEQPDLLLNREWLSQAGMTWEDVLSLAGSTLDKAKVWETVIPSMGYMALLRNLRNFDGAGVSDTVAQIVAGKLSDREQVARSRQLPMRFLSAYRAAPSLRWSYPLEQALGHCLANIPQLPGRTLVLVDTSGSMNSVFSKDGTLQRWDAAVIFGIALAQRAAAADVVSFDTRTKAFPLQPGESLLRSLKRWQDGGWNLNGGTETAAALRRHYDRHDRVVILTDEQAAHTHDSFAVSQSAPATVPIYTWNLAGYKYGHAPSGTGNRHTFGGLTDAAFRMIPLLEAHRSATWPWMEPSVNNYGMTAAA